MSINLTPGRFTSGSDGLVPASGGGSVNVLFANGTWGPPGSSSGPFAMSQHVIASNTTITAAYSALVSRYVKIAAGVTLSIGADGDLEIT